MPIHEVDLGCKRFLKPTLISAGSVHVYWTRVSDSNNYHAEQLLHPLLLPVERQIEGSIDRLAEGGEREMREGLAIGGTTVQDTPHLEELSRDQ